MQRREKPLDDLVSVLMEAQVDGDRLTEPEFDSFFLLLAVAGNETTRNLITGGTLAFLEHDDQREEFLRDTDVLARWGSFALRPGRAAPGDGDT